jgi:hypothetical protein
MSRTPSRARWAGLALALSLLVPSVVAADHHKSVSECTSFDQVDKGETNVEMTVHNSCSIAVSCDVTWRVVCVPGGNKRRSVHPGAAKLTLEENTSQAAEASAAVCGDGSWQIDAIEWSCQEDHS